MKAKNMLLRAALLVLLLAVTACGRSYPEPRYFSLFDNTPVEELAEAVSENDLERINWLVVHDGADVNYQDSVHGFTVLMTALLNVDKHYTRVDLKTIDLLLSLGADPNLYADGQLQSGHNAVTLECQCNNYEALKLLLKYGGDPNSRRRVTGNRWDSDATALMESIISLNNIDDLRCMELLLRSGADVAAVAGEEQSNVFDLAGVHCDKILLLLRYGAEIDLPIYCRDWDEYLTLPEELRRLTFSLDSKSYKDKLKLIEYLKTRGVDYYSYPIREATIKKIKEEYPDTWEEYIKVY